MSDPSHLNQDEFIKKVRIDKYFTTTFNQSAQDHSLSWSARGVLWYLLSLPDDWKINRRHLASQYSGDQIRGNGIDSIKKIMKELQDKGYLVYRKERNEKGHWIHNYYLYPVPVHDFQKMFPQVDQPPVDKPRVVKPPIYTKKESDKEINRTVCSVNARETAPDPSDQPHGSIKKVSKRKGDGTSHDCSIDDAFTHAVQHKCDWTSDEINIAWKALVDHNGIVNNFMGFIKGTIDNLRKKQHKPNKPKHIRSKKCAVQRKKYNGTRSTTSEKTTKEPPSQNNVISLVKTLKKSHPGWKIPEEIALSLDIQETEKHT